jgi:hypothetical protein
MTDVFQTDTDSADWTFKAQPSAVLEGTSLPIDKKLFAGLTPIKPKHDGAYWALKTKGMNFNEEDRIDFNAYNHILWEGLMGSKPYPAKASGQNPRDNREELLPNTGE